MSSIKNLEFEKTAFLSKANSAFIEEMYSRFIANDPNLPESWRNYFQEIGEELDVVVKELNGPSWSPTQKISVQKNQKQITQIDKSSDEEIINSNAKFRVYKCIM